MSQYALDNFGAHKKAAELFHFVVVDVAELRKDPRAYRLVAQQVASADSICANIEEGYGRLSRAEYVRFLDFARGPARETRGRYQRMKHWLAEDIIRQRVDLADEVISIVTKTIETLRRDLQTAPNRSTYIREETLSCVSDEDRSPSTLDARHSSAD